MTRIFSILLLAVALSGCASLNDKIKAVSGFAVTQSQLDAAQSTYDGTSLVSLDKYAALPRCKTGQTFKLTVPCHDRAILVNWRNVDKSVAQGFANTQMSIASGDNTGAVAAWNTLQNALNVAKQIAASSGASTLP